MVAILSLIFVIVISLLVVRVASVALTLTGVSPDLARFQARSAFTGTGFATSEAEQVVRHPVRRRIISLLMLLGNAGLVTAATTLILSFANVPVESGWAGSIWVRIGVLIIAVLILWKLAHSEWVDRRLERLITKLLTRYTTLEVRDYAGLLHLSEDYTISEMYVRPGDWLADRELARLGLSREGILILGITRAGGRYIGAPRGETVVHPHDTVLVYGRVSALADLDQRPAGPEGNRAHVRAVSEQAVREKRMRRDDAADDDAATEPPAAHADAVDQDSARERAV